MQLEGAQNGGVTMGKGYTSVMAEVLNYAANNPDILSKAHS